MHRNAVINEEQPRFQCEIISIANATHCTHWLTAGFRADKEVKCLLLVQLQRSVKCSTPNIG